MLISPLEQFNILSLYDFSPFILTGFDIISAKLLSWVHFTIFFNNPVLSIAAVADGSRAALAGPPLFWVVTNFFVTLETAVLGAFLPFIYSISALAYELVSTAGLTGMATIIDSVPASFYDMRSFLWYVLRANTDLLYSPDHLLFSKVFDLGASFFSETNQRWDMGAPDSINTTPGLAGPFVESNLSLIYGNLGFLIANLYFLLMEIGLSAWTLTCQTALEGLLWTTGTKDLSYLIFSLNTSTVWLTFGFLFLTFLFTATLVSVTIVSRNRWQTLLEIFYDLVLTIVSSNAGPKGRKFFPLIFTTFMIILVCNIQGMIPYSFTVTSHLIVTFSLALAIFIGINILGILKNRRHFLSLFFPPGAPLALAPLLVFIELVSYVFRVLSLSIRLFANLMSGHTLLKILSGFAWAAVSAWGLFLIPLVIIFLVTGLELAIAFLQAYIFSVLLCIYINDAFNLH